MSTIQAVFWDYDNTILATADAHWKKHQTVLAQHGIELSEVFRKKIYENNGNQNWAWMKNELGLDVPEKEYLEAVDFEFQKHITNLAIRPGVTELFELIEKLGIPQAIITNARRDSAKPVLDEKKITSFMQFILFKEDYEGRKPEPTPYLRGFEKMQIILEKPIEPKKCIAIEDDPNGVASAHAAGATVIQRKLTENEVDSPYADYCCFHKDAFIKIVTSLLKT
ncbi:MAG: HAD family phosphatase [Chlamydiota bacterium]